MPPRIVRQVLVGLLTLLLLEVALRAFDFLDPTELDDPYMGFPGSAPVYRLEEDDDGDAVYRTSPNKDESYRVQEFPATKPADELRVFCIGGSSVQNGQFKNPDASFSTFLEMYLDAAATGGDVRVVNAGGGATGTVQNLEVVREVLDYEPDLLVVYPEGGERNHVGPTPGGQMAARDEASPLRVAARRRLADLRIYVGVREAYNALFPVVPKAHTRTAFSGIMAHAYSRPFSEDTYTLLFEYKDTRAPVLMEHVLPAEQVAAGQARFRRNLEAMVDLAEARDVPIVFVQPTRNLASSTYLRFHIDPSEIRDGEVETWRASYDRGLAAMAERDWSAAIEAFEAVRATYVDDRDELLAYHLSRCLERVGRPRDAAYEVVDAHRRHPLWQILREVAEARGVPLLDPYPTLVEEAGGAVPGHDLYLDSFHPMPAASLAIGRALAKGIASSGLLAGVEDLTLEVIAEVTRDGREVAAESRKRHTPSYHQMRSLIAEGDELRAVQIGRTGWDLGQRGAVMTMYYGWALTRAGYLGRAEELFDETRAQYVRENLDYRAGADDRSLVEQAFNGDVFAFL